MTVAEKERVTWSFEWTNQRTSVRDSAHARKRVEFKGTNQRKTNRAHR